MKSVRRLAFLFSLAALAASSAMAHERRIRAGDLPTCSETTPDSVWLLDAASATTCDGTTGEYEAHCCCANGAWAACGGSGGGSGDVEAVWGCASGDCSDLTAASGDSLDAGSADDSSPATRSTSLPGTCSEGQWHQDTDSGGSETYVCTASNTWTKLSVTSSDRLPSLANPPASPHAYDCEFDDGVTGCSGWSINTGTLTSGTVAPFASLTDPIYDATSWDGWLLAQSDETSGTAIAAATNGSITQDTDEQWIFRVFSSGEVSTSGEARSGICLSNSGTSGENVCAGLHTAGASERVEIFCTNGGAVTSDHYGSTLPAMGAPDVVMVLQKISNAYYLYPLAPGGGGWHGTFGLQHVTCTKTGVTSFDTVSWWIGTANETPSRYMGIDFVRYRASSGLPPMNP